MHRKSTPEIDTLVPSRNIDEYFCTVTIGLTRLTTRSKLYKAKLKEWEIGKNAASWQWLIIGRELLQQRDDGRLDPAVWFHSKVRRMPDTKRHAKHIGMTVVQFEESARACDRPTPAYIRPYQRPMTLSATSQAEHLRAESSQESAAITPPQKGSPPQFRPQSAAEQDYRGACQLASLAEARRDQASKANCIASAALAFDRMCTDGYMYVLVVAAEMLTLLGLYVEGSLLRRIISASYTSAATTLGNDSPVSMILEWMTALVKAEGKAVDMRTCRVGTATLRRLLHDSHNRPGREHPQTMVITYCLAFHLMFTDRLFAEAEAMLLELWNTSVRLLGENDVFSVNVLAGVGRAQHRQGKRFAALFTLDRCLSVFPLGLNHPHRLELLVRKAVVFCKLEQYQDAEELYWQVARGRAAVLGRHHKTTLAAHESLCDALKKTGEWDERKDECHRIIAEPGLEVETPDSWWRDSIEALQMEKQTAGDSEDEEHRNRGDPGDGQPEELRIW